MSRFFYFAYGSNLLMQKLHMNHPSAMYCGSGQLKGYRLDFNSRSVYWDGSSSTVVRDKNEIVWGVIWTMDVCHMDSLDKQEGVHIGLYLPFDVRIFVDDGVFIVCRCYKLAKQPRKRFPLPYERRPSKTYLETILLGAQANSFPYEYLEFLRKIPDNGKDGPKVPWISYI